MRATDLLDTLYETIQEIGDFEVMMPDPLVNPLGTAWTGSIGCLLQTPDDMSPMLLLIAHPHLAKIKDGEGNELNPFDNPKTLEA